MISGVTKLGTEGQPSVYPPWGADSGAGRLYDLEQKNVSLFWDILFSPLLSSPCNHSSTAFTTSDRPDECAMFFTSDPLILWNILANLMYYLTLDNNADNKCGWFMHNLCLQ